MNGRMTVHLHWNSSFRANKRKKFSEVQDYVDKQCLARMTPEGSAIPEKSANRDASSIRHRSQKAIIMHIKITRTAAILLRPGSGLRR